MGIVYMPRKTVYAQFVCAVENKEYDLMVVLIKEIETRDLLIRRLWRLYEIADNHAFRALHAGSVALFRRYMIAAGRIHAQYEQMISNEGGK